MSGGKYSDILSDGGMDPRTEYEAERFKPSEEQLMLEQRNEALMDILRQVDYMISYGMVREARDLIHSITGEHLNGE